MIVYDTLEVYTYVLVVYYDGVLKEYKGSTYPVVKY